MDRTILVTLGFVQLWISDSGAYSLRTVCSEELTVCPGVPDSFPCANLDDSLESHLGEEAGNKIRLLLLSATVRKGW